MHALHACAYACKCKSHLPVRVGSALAPARLSAPDPVLHVSASVRRGGAADARIGLA